MRCFFTANHFTGENFRGFLRAVLLSLELLFIKYFTKDLWKNG